MNLGNLFLFYHGDHTFSIERRQKEFFFFLKEGSARTGGEGEKMVSEIGCYLSQNYVAKCMESLVQFIMADSYGDILGV